LRPYPIHSVSVVIPVYNEQQSLPELLRRTEAACALLPEPYEIVLVDDGSRDDSAALLEQAAERVGSHVVAVILNRNYGQHAAIMAGFEAGHDRRVLATWSSPSTPTCKIPRRKSPAWSPRRAWATTWSPRFAAIARTRPCAAGPRG
jgi:undecaprenyl-phosphate 4-deoxy-4-formamido-L-arabinose transferase